MAQSDAACAFAPTSQQPYRPKQEHATIARRHRWRKAPMLRNLGPSARQTRIVATIGLCHDTDYPTFLTKLCDAGADVLRLNMSHADPDYAKERAVLAWANHPTPNLQAPRVAVMADLQGPKCRIGKLSDDGLELLPGHSVVLVPEGAPYDPRHEQLPDGSLPPLIPVPEPTGTSLVDGLRAFLADNPAARPTVLFGDGDLIVEVAGLGPHHVRATVVAGGILGSKKGLTVREIDLELDPFPAKDQADLQFCLDQGIDFVAISFVRSAADLQRIRAFVRANLPLDAREPRLIAKIETLAAVDRIDEILAAADGIMVARGDLGLQLGFDEVPAVQKRLVVAARRQAKPCIIATQMLESMITLPLPTRAEATDVFNAILDGGDAVMLSGETSVGVRPYRVVETMDRIARKAEAFRLEERKHHLPLALPDDTGLGHVERINVEFAKTAVQFAEHLPAFAIACFTRTGRTPERISRYRPPVPTLAFCATAEVARQCLLFWGVHPVVLQGGGAQKARLAEMVRQARTILRENYAMQPGDALVVTAGVDWVRGGTNVLQVLIEDHAAAEAATDAT